MIEKLRLIDHTFLAYYFVLVGMATKHYHVFQQNL